MEILLEDRKNFTLLLDKATYYGVFKYKILPFHLNITSQVERYHHWRCNKINQAQIDDKEIKCCAEFSTPVVGQKSKQISSASNKNRKNWYWNSEIAEKTST